MSFQLWQTSSLRDYAGWWNAPCIRNLEALNNPGCFRQSLWSAPKFNERVIPEGGYTQSQVALPVGGYLWGFGCSFNDGASDFARFLVTDLSLNRPFSNAPLEAAALRGSPFILPDLYPIVSPGLFRVECWNGAPAGDGEIVAELVLMIVEPVNV